MTEDIFWLDKFEGTARGGLFIRNELFKFIKLCELKGMKIVGIRKPTEWNMELMFTEEEKHDK